MDGSGTPLESHPAPAAAFMDSILIAAIDLRGRYRDPFPNWEAATDAPSHRLRADIEILPQIAEAQLAAAAKDISQGGIVGTAIGVEAAGKSLEDVAQALSGSG
jgi:selenophosphate synthetase-related protein